MSAFGEQLNFSLCQFIALCILFNVTPLTSRLTKSRMMSVMHWIETKDTSNSLTHAYNKITDSMSGVN